MRGYGLVDSDKTTARPGDDLSLTATVAATPQAAAEVYPANYWYSLLEIPAEDQFPGTGPRGNGIGEHMLTQSHWVDRLKDGCQLCHQMGNKATREMPMLNLRDFDSTLAAWQHRVQAGGSGPMMLGALSGMGSGAGAVDVCRLDGPDSGRRGSAAAAAARGDRAQRRAVDVGLGRPARVHPRRGRHRQAESEPQRERAGLRSRQWPPRRGAGHHRPGRASVDRSGPAGPRDTGARRGERVHRRGGEPVPLLGGRAAAGRWPRGWQRAQSDDGPSRAHLADPVDSSWRRQPGVVPGGLGSPIGHVLPGRAEFYAPPAVVLRPHDRQLRADRHLLRHAPSAVCRRRERHALVER